MRMTAKKQDVYFACQSGISVGEAFPYKRGREASPPMWRGEDTSFKIIIAFKNSCTKILYVT